MIKSCAREVIDPININPMFSIFLFYELKINEENQSENRYTDRIQSKI